MIKQKFLFLTLSLFFGSHVVCMEHVEFDHSTAIEMAYRMGSAVDLPSANAFFQTSKDNYCVYGAINPTDYFLWKNGEVCGSLPVNTYLAALTRFAQRKNEPMIVHLVSNENSEQKEARQGINTFFGYPLVNDLDGQYVCTMLSFQGSSYGNNNEKCVISAMKQINRQALKVLIKNRVEIDTVFDCPNSCFFGLNYFSWALANNDREIIEQLKNAGANVNAAGASGNILLHACVDRGETAAIKLLLEWGADINKRNDLGHKPFNYAASYEIQKLLVENGAELEWTDKIKYSYDGFVDSLQ